MPIFLNSQSADFETAFAALLGAKREDSPDVDAIVADIIADVRTRGDDAVLDLTAKFDRLTLTPSSMRFTTQEIAQYCDQVLAPEAAALELAAARIRSYHERQLPQDASWDDSTGARLGWRWGPVSAAGPGPIDVLTTVDKPTRRLPGCVESPHQHGTGRSGHSGKRTQHDATEHLSKVRTTPHEKSYRYAALAFVTGDEAELPAVATSTALESTPVEAFGGPGGPVASCQHLIVVKRRTRRRPCGRQWTLLPGCGSRALDRGISRRRMRSRPPRASRFHRLRYSRRAIDSGRACTSH